MLRKPVLKPCACGRRALMLIAIAASAMVGPQASAEDRNKSSIFLHCEGESRILDGARPIEKNKKIRRVWIARDGSWIEIYQNGVMRYPRSRYVHDLGNIDVIWYYDSTGNNPDDTKIQTLTFTPFRLGFSFDWKQISTNVFVAESFDCTVAINPFMRIDD